MFPLIFDKRELSAQQEKVCQTKENNKNTQLILIYVHVIQCSTFIVKMDIRDIGCKQCLLEVPIFSPLTYMLNQYG